MRTKLCLTGLAMVVALALAAPASAAFIGQAHLTIVQNGFKPTWKLRYLLCHVAPGTPAAEVSEATYRRGAKQQTLQVWMWAKRSLPHPATRGSGSCSWYHSETFRSHFPQRAGYVTAVTLEIFDPSGQTITRTFPLNP